jgi:hypothetical protein
VAPSSSLYRLRLQLFESAHVRKLGERAPHEAATPIITAPPATTAATVPIKEATAPTRTRRAVRGADEHPLDGADAALQLGRRHEENRRGADVHADHVREAGDRERGERGGHNDVADMLSALEALATERRPDDGLLGSLLPAYYSELPDEDARPERLAGGRLRSGRRGES